MTNNTSIRNLLLVSMIQKRFLNTTSATLSPTPTPTSSSSSSFTVQFLINSFGLPSKSAVSVSKKLQLDQKKHLKFQAVLEFLKSHDFNNTHIAKLIEKRPTVLQCRVESHFKPKFNFLIKNGFVGQLLPELILSNMGILTTGLHSRIKPAFQFLKSFVDSNDNVLAAVRRYPMLLTFDLKSMALQNIDFLITQGVAVSSITKLICKHPRALLHKHDRIVYTVNAVKNLGLKPEATLFTPAVRVMLSMSESKWLKKIEVMKSLGWSEEEILLAFKRWPYYLGCSEEKIRIAMDFYMNTMNLERQIIVRYPMLLGFAIDKRVRRRYNVFKVLESKKLIKGDRKIEYLLMLSEKKFLEKYVTKFVDIVPGLLQINGGKDNAKKMDAR